ncbi:hypothetical protein GW17_00038330 [Ensete ventricosum]|nr:hypothetical protein GW17_00038330 [Ensete ventricosum]
MDRDQEPRVGLVHSGLREQLRLQKQLGRRRAVALSRITGPVLATKETEQRLLCFDGCEWEERALGSVPTAESGSGVSLAEEHAGDAKGS